VTTATTHVVSNVPEGILAWISNAKNYRTAPICETSFANFTKSIAKEVKNERIYKQTKNDLQAKLDKYLSGLILSDEF
jgi:hypothetical protein